MQHKINFSEDVLKQKLSTMGFDMIRFHQQKTNDLIEAEANKLLAVYLHKGEPLYVPVPVTLSIKLDDDNNIERIEGGDPTPEAAKDAEWFVKTLIDNHRIGNLENEIYQNATHQIE